MSDDPSARSVQTDWVGTFLAIAEHAGIRSAGHVLHLSQSRVSAHLAALERVVGVRLIERGPRGARLTTAGEAFRAHARLAIEELGAGVVAARDRARDSVRFGLCAPIPPALLTGLEWPPSIRPTFVELSPEQVAASLRAGTIDAAISPACHLDDSVAHRPIWTEAAVLVSSLTLAASESVYVVSDELPLLRDAGYPFSAPPLAVPSVSLALALVGSGMGSALLTQGSAPPSSNSYNVAVGHPAARIVYHLAWPDPAPAWIDALTRRHLQAVPDSESGMHTFAGVS